MSRQLARYVGALAPLLVTLTTPNSFAAAPKVERVWSHDAGGPGRAEIVAYDAPAEEFLVVNGTERCVMRIDARTGRERGRMDVAAYGDPTSVTASQGLVAVAVVAPIKTDPGRVIIFRSAADQGGDDARVDSAPVAVVRVPAQPDMVTFTPDGRFILAADEGEPSDDYSVDPEGSVSVIDVARGPEQAIALTADFIAFNSQAESLQKQGVRLTAPNPTDGRATVAQDLEPEFIAVTPDGATAWVTLQENNALAEVDVANALVRRIVGLGLKDHSRSGNGLDVSDRDGGPNIRLWPVFGMYQPDGIAAFDAGGETFLVTANEGDGREYSAFSDSARVAELKLDGSFLAIDPKRADETRLGRLIVSRVDGDTDGDGDVDRLLAFGARSLAIWNSDGQLVYDSGDAIEQFIAENMPERFNIEGTGVDNVDTRSDDKGPEPEGIAMGRVGETMLAFVGLERTSAVAVFDVTRPAAAKLVDVVPLALQAEAEDGPHVAPEGLCFVSADRSPLGEPLLAVACEVTGTTILYRVDSVSDE